MPYSLCYPKTPEAQTRKETKAAQYTIDSYG